MTDTEDRLEDERHLRHQRREWLIERVGWIAMLGVVVAAVAGLLGPGLLAARSASNADQTLSARWNAVEHRAAPVLIRFTLRSLPEGEPVRLRLSRTFCDAVTATSLVPRPQSIDAEGDDVVYTFAAPRESALSVTVRFEYEEIGRFDFQAQTPGREPIAIRQRVLP